MEQELFQNRREHLNLTSISSPQLFILEIASSDCFCQKSKYNACEVFLLEYFFFFFIHGDWKGKYIYMLVPCAICGGFQSMETYVSTSQVAQFGFSDGCNWSPILWHFCTRELLQVKQAPYVKRLFFFFHHHHIQLHLEVIDSLFTELFYHHVLKPRESHPLHGVYCRSLLGPWPSVAPWQAGESPLPQRTVYDCFNVVSLVFRVPAKTQPHINWLPCADLKITSAQIAKAERNLNCTQCYYLYPWQRWWHFIVPLCTCPLLMMPGCFTISVSFREKTSPWCPLQ